MHLHIPDLSLIVLIGASGSGKSTFARTHFLPTEVVSSDFCRALISNNENSMDASDDAFELLHFLIAKRLKRGLLTVVDATNVEAYSRKKLIQLAKDFHVLPVAVVFNLPEEISMERNKLRSDRNFGNHVIAKHVQSLRKSLRTLKSEGFRQIEVFRSEEEVQSIQGFVREPLYNDRRTEQGPFDIIGDIHGCYDELTDLLRDLGYEIHQVEENGSNYGIEVIPPPGRRALFLGDLVDRGPKSPQVLRLVMSMVKAGTAFCVPGNHDIKLEKKLSGKEVQLKYGLAETMQQLEQEPESFRREVKDFIYRMVSHYVLDNGKLVTAHAGLREEMHGRASGAVRSFCLYGETTGEIDEFGLPVRQNWAAEYRGRALVVYGHTPVPAPDFLNHTINIDTGCVFGGHLTALR
jgi:protein phosphatase